MKFAANRSSLLQKEQTQLLPQEYSSVINDNEIDSFINFMNYLSALMSDQMEGANALLGVDQNGELTLLDADYQLQDYEPNLQNYGEDICNAIEYYQKEQFEMLQKQEEQAKLVKEKKLKEIYKCYRKYSLLKNPLIMILYTQLKLIKQKEFGFQSQSEIGQLELEEQLSEETIEWKWDKLGG